MIIYKITNKINGKIYIGQTINDLEKRTIEHKYEARSGRRNSPVHNAMRKYGIENFTFIIIDNAASMEELNKKEQTYIEQLKSLKPNGYNLALGGRGRGMVSIDTRKKMSESRKKLLSDKKNHPNWGKSSGNAKQIICLNNGLIYKSEKQASIELQLDHSLIARVCKNIRPHAKGYRFKYL